MSQLLAVLTGPAFYPLPGIGRVFKVFNEPVSVGINSTKMQEYLEAKTKAAKEKRETILRLIQE